MGMFSKKIISKAPIAKAKSFPYKKNKSKAFEKKILNEDNFNKWLNNGKTYSVEFDSILIDRAAVLKTLFSAITRYYPIASSAVWVWNNLTSTKQKVTFSGGTDSEREKAKDIIKKLNLRLSPFKSVKGGGMDLLISQYFLNLFKFGRFSGILNLSPNLDQIDSFEIIDAFKVKFDKNLNSYYSLNGIDFLNTNENTFYYFALSMDTENPYGIALLEAAHSMMVLADEMLEDMKLSSSNAGLPRLHVKITQPDKLEYEDDEEYIKRTSAYFDEYINQFSEISADDNYYSWNDVEIGVVGGSTGAGGFVWRSNRQVLDEEIITAFHLFPWILGKSASTTKNWVRSQFDLLMAEITNIQNAAKSFSEWIKNIELKLHGINNVIAIHNFEQPRDPAKKDMAIAERFEIQNVDTKVRRGIISPDDGARELGYDKAEDPVLWLAGTDDKEDLNHKDDSNSLDSINSKLDDIEEKITINNQIENDK